MKKIELLSDAVDDILRLLLPKSEIFETDNEGNEVYRIEVQPLFDSIYDRLELLINTYNQKDEL